VEHLRKRRTRYSPNTGIAFIYCSNKNRNPEGHAMKFISSLARQLVPHEHDDSANMLDLVTLVKDLYEKCQKKNTPPSYDDHRVLLRSMCQKFTQTFIIIDGLNEWSNEDSQNNRVLDNFFPTLQDLLSFSRVLVTARSRASILDNTVNIGIHASESDINAYLESEIDKSSDFATRVRKNEGLMDQIVKRIAKESDRK
jgi:hypothetical protein